MTTSRHITLVPGAVATVDLDDLLDTIEVVNRDGAAEVYFTVGDQFPTVEGDDTIVLPAAIGGVTITPGGSVAPVVHLISSGSPRVSVRGY